MKTLVVYLMSGPKTPELAAAAVAGGADLIELGFPFSDPLADGPVIRRAAERALGQGMRTRACLDCLARTRELVPETPLVPMTYAALLEAYGWDRFAHDAQSAGATSLIVADLPVDVRPELRRIQLVAPTSTDERVRIAAEHTDGWLYLVTLTGTTGARDGVSPPWPASSNGRARSRTSRSTRASGSRVPSRRAPPPNWPTASSSARARSRSPRTGRGRWGSTSARCATLSTRWWPSDLARALRRRRDVAADA